MTILVCINSHPKAYTLLRAAARKAKESALPWTVLYIETSEHFSLDNESRERILYSLDLAQTLGATVVQLEIDNIVEGITSYIDDNQHGENAVTKLIIGQRAKSGLFDELRASFAERTARFLRHYPVEIQIIPLPSEHYSPSAMDRLQLRDFHISHILWPIFYVACAYAGSELLHLSLPQIVWSTNIQNVLAIFMIAIIVAALRHGLLTGLATAVGSFVAMDYFYTMPIKQFGLDNKTDGISLSVFLLSAVIVSLMGAYSRASKAALIKKEKRSQALFRLHRLAANANSHEEALSLLHKELSKLLEMDVVFFLPPTLDPDSILDAYPSRCELKEADKSTLNSCWRNMCSTGIGAKNPLHSTWRFEPMITSRGDIGVLGVSVPKDMRISASFGRLLTALADQTASILERIELSQEAGKNKIHAEREKLRAMLLSSVSHDLKTPLASIIGSMSVYTRLKKSGRLTDDIANELVETSLDEAQRLDSFITNILDMTRIESGDIAFSFAWEDSRTPLDAVIKRLRQRLSKHQVKITQHNNIEYHVEMDTMMTEQVLQNVIDNAAKYSPAGSVIEIDSGKDEAGFYYSIRDSGLGIPEEKIDAVFDKYERLKQTDSQVAGTGLGLAICRAVMEKQCGKIIAGNSPLGGAVFTIRFPNYKIVKNIESVA